MTPVPRNPGGHIAVASSDGSHVNMHLGEADHLLVYDLLPPKAKLVGIRKVPPPTPEGSRWATLADLLGDCSLLLAGGIGPVPRALLDQHGIRVRTVRGPISEILAQIDVTVSDADGGAPFVCGEGCNDNRSGCGSPNRGHHGCFGA